MANSFEHLFLHDPERKIELCCNRDIGLPFDPIAQEDI